MLLNDFFRIVALKVVSPDTLIAAIRLNPEHEIFSGHFPGNPVTPGVVQIQIVKEILEEFHKKELRMVTIAQCKFVKILNPDIDPEITIEINSSITGKQIAITASGTEKENIFFKLKATYTL